MAEKNLDLDRTVFFSDAVVAIAITLLALDLKVEVVSDSHITFSDIGNIWQSLLAFALSFLNIAIFWKIHHQMFQFIKKVDQKMLWYNFGWLLFIVTLPFSTSLVSSHFTDAPAIFLYCLNTLFITLFQNQLWNYTVVRPDYVKEDLDKATNYNYRLSFNVATFNALLACGLSLFFPVVAFMILFTRLPMISIANKIFKPTSI